MTRLLALLLPLFLFLLPAATCTPIPVPPVAVGGSVATGGAPQGGAAALGGVASSGGQTSSHGGSEATGGASATTSIKWLACNASAKARPVQPRNLTGWHKSKVRSTTARPRPSYSLVAASVFWTPNLATPLDQGSLGSCTGNAVAQCLSTRPFASQLTELDAVRIYSLATQLDPYQGTYPPTDTGSNGESAARAAKQLGYTDLDFEPADTLEALQQHLQRASCVIGVNWYDGFNDPTPCGEMVLRGALQGGHEMQIIAWDAELKRFAIRNSWGPDWGNCRDGSPEECGYAYWSAGTLQTLLNRGAEIDCPVM